MVNPKSPLWADAEYFVLAQSSEGTDSAHSEGSWQGRWDDDGDDIQCPQHSLLHLVVEGVGGWKG